MAAQSLAVVGNSVQGFCPLSHGSHGGQNFSGAWGSLPIPPHNITVDGISAILVGDVGQASCGHTFIAVTGSPGTTTIGGIAIHRTGDGIGIVQFSPTAIVGTTVVTQSDCDSN